VSDGNLSLSFSVSTWRSGGHPCKRRQLGYPFGSAWKIFLSDSWVPKMCSWCLVAAPYTLLGVILFPRNSIARALCCWSSCGWLANYRTREKDRGTRCSREMLLLECGFGEKYEEMNSRIEKND